MNTDFIFEIEPKTEEQRLRNILLGIATINAADYGTGTELQWAEAALFRKIRQVAHEALKDENTIC
jgi:hypothetical protein